MPTKISFALLFCGLLLVPLSQAHAISKEDRRTIAMTGAGAVRAPADIAHITAGVVSEAKTARAALDDNTAAMARIVAELKFQAIEPRDIQTTNFFPCTRITSAARKAIGQRSLAIG